VTFAWGRARGLERSTPTLASLHFKSRLRFSCSTFDRAELVVVVADQHARDALARIDPAPPRRVLQEERPGRFAAAATALPRERADIAVLSCAGPNRLAAMHPPATGFRRPGTAGRASRLR
jgi:hypothetical protein